MIDTIKLAVNKLHNKPFYDYLLYKSNQNLSGFFIKSETGVMTRQKAFVMSCTKYDEFESLVINGSIQTPSHLYNIYFRCFETHVDLEFSLPKLLYGNNSIQLLNHTLGNSQCPYSLLRKGVKYFFELNFPYVKINYGGVVLKRVDFCFNQHFKNYDESISALKYIKLKHQSKSDKLNYEFGFVELTKSKYLKIYHKGVEFKKHDYHKLKTTYEADIIQNFSNSILRYERKCTPKNWSYNFNVNYKMKHYNKKKQSFYLAKKYNKVTKEMRRDFENVQNFTLGIPLEPNYLKLDKRFFNDMFFNFKTDIKKKFTIGKVSTNALRKEVINPKDKKNQTIKLRILAYIKVFKSLKKAQESGAFSKKTLYRYNKFMTENNWSTTAVKSEIFQHWDYNTYYNNLFAHNIKPFKFSKNIDF